LYQRGAGKTTEFLGIEAFQSKTFEILWASKICGSLGQSPNFQGIVFTDGAWFILIQNDLYNFSVKRHPSNVKKSLFATL